MSFMDHAEKSKLVYNKYFNNIRNGFFVDVGANDGVSINCSLFFEQAGWNGICIEPIKRLYKLLVSNRPNSICLNIALYKESGIFPFMENTGGNEMLSGLEQELHPDHLRRITQEATGTDWTSLIRMIPCYTLDHVLSEHKITHIDYLKIDTEGSELTILQGLDLQTISVSTLDIEANYPSERKRNDQYLAIQGYVPALRLGIDTIYRRFCD